MSKLPSILPPPLGYRKKIPLYYPKTEAEIKADSYEIYNPNVIRSCRNFYEGEYGQILLNQVKQHLKSEENQSILELGCGSGYLIGHLAESMSHSEHIGLDYSYQMLKIADQVFKNQNSKEVKLAAFQNGMEDLVLETRNLTNLTYGLSDACVTPLPDNSIDFCFSCFLWDRVRDPANLLEEKMRIVKPGGTIILISPFNYLTQKGWQEWHPIETVLSKIKEQGLELVDHQKFALEEMLDVRRNRVVWEVESLVFKMSV